MRYLSLFSGIEAATVAWEPLGWQAAAFAEIDPFACDLLAHYYPGVPNLGDVTRIARAQIETLGHIDIVVFGSPCQDLSVAGKRGGLKGARSGLFFRAMDIVRWSRARFALWENVPGAFSSNEGRDFALVAGEMAGVEFDVPADGWQNAGVALGPDGLVEWCVLDAQFFGVPQRRRRIFALRDSGDWASRPPVLLEPESMHGHPAPCRETGQGVAGSLGARTTAGGGFSTDFECQGGLIACYGGNNTAGSIDSAAACNAKGGSGRMDFETETFVTHALDAASGGHCTEDGTGRGVPLVTVQNTGHGWWSQSDTAQTLRTPDGGGSLEANLVAHSLSADGFDASEDGSGRGTPLVPALAPTLRAGKNESGGDRPPGTDVDTCESLIPVVADPISANEKRTYTHEGNNFRTHNLLVVPILEAGARTGTSTDDPRAGMGVGDPGDPMFTLQGGKQHAVAFTERTRADGRNFEFQEDIAYALTNPGSGGRTHSRQIMTFEKPVAFAVDGDGVAWERNHVPTLLSHLQTDTSHIQRGIRQGMSVRRLTPVECERLQGFPDNYTLIPYRGKPAADGPRYRALGNSMAVPVMRWIGERIAAMLRGQRDD